METQLKFVLVAMTGAIVNDLQMDRGIAEQVVGEAASIPTDCYDESNYERRAGQYVGYSYGLSDRPAWLPSKKAVDTEP